MAEGAKIFVFGKDARIIPSSRCLNLPPAVQAGPAPQLRGEQYLFNNEWCVNSQKKPQILTMPGFCCFFV